MKKYINVDGNTATANIAYLFSEVAEIYPITPSSNMSELIDEWAQTGRENLFGMPVRVEQLQSEAGVAGALHGSLATGVLSTTFTSSQGLLLMIPNMFKLAGEHLPAVFHVSARAVATHALSIFGDHSDVMACRTTGFNMICSSSVQEAQDMALVAHLSALKASLPFLHFFDGFRTSHEIQKIEAIDEQEIKKLIPYELIQKFKSQSLNPSHPHQQGTAQNPDVFFQNRETSNTAYGKVYEIVEQTMQEVGKLTGRNYTPFEYIGSPNATHILVMMGSGVETAIETLPSLDEKFGIVKVRLYRPFNSKAFVESLPKTTKTISVLDRTKESGANFEPLCLDVMSALNEHQLNIKVLGGRYGLGGKEFSPACVKAVFDNMASDNPKNHFTVGIVDDVTHLSLELDHNFEPKLNSVQLKFYGLGGDGTISANKNTIKIIGEKTDKYIQGYFEYDSKKSGSLTISHLRISDTPILSTYAIQKADFIAIHNFNFVARYDILDQLKQNGTVLLNTALNKDQLDDELPNVFKDKLIQKNAKFYIINAQKIADELNLNNKINTIMQAAFFKLSNVIDYDFAEKEMKKAVELTYGKKGDQTVKANFLAIERGANSIEQVDTSILTLKQTPVYEKQTDNEYYKNYIEPINRLKGNQLKVSAFSPNGKVPTDTTKYEKRGIASHLPEWIKENCIQCGYCTLVCPHAAIRSKVIAKESLENKPQSFETISAIGVQNCEYKIQVSPLDCTGCGVCANVCPALKKALVMRNASELMEKEKENFNYFETLSNQKTPFSKTTVKGIQFEKPYFEYNYACAGCGETPYIKIATQLFGEHMIIANATGCSSIYGGYSPACPYSKNQKGYGPAWANSLFEDNAEFGLGMSYAIEVEKAKLAKLIEEYLTILEDDNLKQLLNKWLEGPNTFTNDQAEELVEQILKQPDSEIKSKILLSKDYIAKKSVWIIGGDGWAYDINFGGIDHILSTNQNVNILVLDSEVYSNTGGQISKSTPRGSFAKFAFGGKKNKKKDLAMQAIVNGNCYVASIGLGANYQQTIKALTEAEAFDGPSLIIAYSPCVNHGYDMSRSQEMIKLAVQCGYWHLFRYNPITKNLEIDSPAPTASYEDFLLMQSRYSALLKKYPEKAKELFELSKKDAEERYQKLLKLKQN